MAQKVSVSVSLELGQAQWLEEQDQNRSVLVRDLIDSEMERQ